MTNFQNTQNTVEIKTETKTCKLCNTPLPLDAFAKRTQNKDGHNAACKCCVNKWTKEYNANRKAAKAQLAAVQNDTKLA